jgi:hypothetical protein
MKTSQIEGTEQSGADMWHLIFAKRPCIFSRSVTLKLLYIFIYDTCGLDAYLHVGPTCQ